MSALDLNIAFYVNRLLFQYQKQKAQNTIAILVRQELADDLPAQVRDAYNVDSAVGRQLDVIGKYVGLPRTIGDPAPLEYFGFVDYAGGGNPNGFTDYTTGENSTVLFFDYTYYGARNTALSDTAYAFMIALKIVLNSNDGTLYSIQNLLRTMLPGFVTVVDNRDMTMKYLVSTAAPVSPTVLQPYLPKPMGVGVTIEQFANIMTDGGDFIVTDGGDKISVDLGGG